MPGTGTRRARKYRAWTLSLKFVGQRSPPADAVEYRRTVRLMFHERPFFSQTTEQLYRRMLKKAVSKAAAAERTGGVPSGVR